jgi:uncharacterized membrane protein
MMTVEKSVEINQPVEKVFEFVSNPANDPLWRTEINSFHLASEGPMGADAKIEQTVHFLGKKFDGAAEVTVYEPNQQLSWKLVGGPVPGVGNNEFEAIGENQTKYTITSEFEVGGFFKIAEPIVARMARRQVEANLANLKDLLEAETSD